MQSLETVTGQDGKQSKEFRPLRPIQTEKIRFLCKKHGFVDGKVLVINNVRMDPICPICEKEESENISEIEKRRREELQAQIRIERYREMNIDEEFWGKTVENYVPKCESQRQAKEAVSRLIEKKHGKVILLGNNGCGKSHLGNAAVSALGGKVYTIYEINTMIRGSYSALATRTELDIVNELASIPMLFIDELGRSKGSKFELDWLSFVCTKRHQRNLPYVIAGNGHLMRDCPNGQAHCDGCFENFLGNDVLSRLGQDTEIVTMYNAPDFRRKK